MKTLKGFTKKNFKAWLDAQPENRTFNFFDSHGCAGYSFVNEFLKKELVTCGSIIVRINDKEFGIPLWFQNLMNKLDFTFTIKQTKSKFSKL
jgi:hypothetical protein